MKTTMVQIFACDKDSSATYSETIQFNSLKKAKEETEKFMKRCPILRYYLDSEFEEGDEELCNEFQDWLSN